MGSVRVLDKIPGSGSGSGRVGMSKYTIGYFRVSFLLSGISGYVRYLRVFPGIYGYLDIISFFLVVISKTLDLPKISDNTRYFGLPDDFQN